MRLRPDLGQLAVTGPTATGCTAEATAPRTAPCTSRSSFACAITPGARAYTARRTTEGLSMPEIIRCQSATTPAKSSPNSPLDIYRSAPVQLLEHVDVQGLISDDLLQPLVLSMLSEH